MASGSALQRRWLVLVFAVTVGTSLAAAAGRRRSVLQGAEDSKAAEDSASGSGAVRTAVGTALLFTPEQAAVVEARLKREARRNRHKAAAAAASVTIQSTMNHQGVLDEHNKFRVLHQVAPLTWSDDVAATALAYAQKCIWAHEQNIPYGENLYITSATADPAAYYIEAVDSWYQENVVVDYNNLEAAFNAGAGHFTQLVWKGSTGLGCAVVVCPSVQGLESWGAATIVDCRYNPPGNWMGQFAANVFPPRGSLPSPSPNLNPGRQDPQPSPSPVYSPPPVALPSPFPFPTTKPAVYRSSCTLQAGFSLSASGCLKSANGKYRLCITKMGIVTLKQGPKILWTINAKVATASLGPAFLVLSDKDASLSVIDNKWNTVRVISAPCPSSACGSPSSSVLVVQNDGNLVLYASAITVATGFRVDGRILWQSGTAQLS